MPNRTLVLSLLGVAVIVLAVWGALRLYHNSSVKNSAQTPSNQSSSITPTNTQIPLVTRSDCQRNFDQTKLQTAVNLRNQFVTLEVKDYGTIRIQLYDKDAPKAVENFLKLTNAGFYDCLTFHRVAQGFVIQTGDPKGDGTGGQSAFGKEFADELNPKTQSYQTGYVKGTVAMANRGPNTNSSQFFITLADVNDTLPKNYTIFGQVVAGLDVVEKIGQVAVNPGPFGPTDGSPKVPVIITKATISQ